MTDKLTLQRIAGNLRRLRTERGLSMAALAKLIEDYPASIERIENEKHMPGVGLLSRIAEALGVGVDDLLKAPAQNLSRAS